MYYETTKELLAFIKKSPTAFHAVEEMQARLTEDGFQVLSEKEHWKLTPGGKYVVTRNHSALIAFTIPEKESWKFHIIASHSDSPSFKIKENPEIVVEEKLIDFDRNLVMIPNLAIHMNREANSGVSYNPQKDMLPLFSMGGSDVSLQKLLSTQLDVEEKDILSHDLFLYNRMEGSIWGAENEFASSARLDDLQCAFASLKGFLGAQKQDCIAVHCVLDNEEVGSGTKQGAASTFLKDTLLRINSGLGRTYEEYLMTLADSFMISADNAHALHPNYTDKADPVNHPLLNKGIVIKYNANQKYCTDAVSAAVFKDLCDRAGVPWQTFVNRSDIPGGSTLGNISNTQVPMNTVDIGLPQLSMHSPYETAGVRDTEYFVKAAKEFFA